ncbi:NHL repeat-containing protein [Gracilimonas halophila]|uniref:6-bladed beta-propeller protein n=1 Tax=Gracilimonas halophila TaxID=1834464 RepID=A0ABW5JI77_9BACT
MEARHLAITILFFVLILTTIIDVSAQDKRTLGDYTLEVTQDILLSEHEIFRPASSIDISESDHRIVFFDLAKYKIVVYDLTHSTFQLFGNRGKGPQEIGQIFDLKVDDGIIFLIDTGNNKIMKWNTDGEFIEEMSVGSRFIRPARLTLCKGSNLMYILSSQYGPNGLIHQYAKVGDLIHSFYEIEDEQERWVYYTDGTLACDEQENLYYAKRYVNEIKKYNENGELIYTLPIYDSEPNEEVVKTNGRYTSLNPSALRYTSNIYYLNGMLYVSYSGLPKNFRYRYIDVYMENQQKYLHSIQLPFEFKSFVMTEDKIAILREDENEEMYLTIFNHEYK